MRNSFGGAGGLCYGFMTRRAVNVFPRTLKLNERDGRELTMGIRRRTGASGQGVSIFYSAFVLVAGGLVVWWLSRALLG